MTPQTCTWVGQSGEEYTYWIYPIGASFKDVPGNYIFAKESSSMRWTPQYIGQAKSLGDRLSSHEREYCAKRNGATHIHAHISRSGEAARLREESDLIALFSPVCNRQGV